MVTSVVIKKVGSGFRPAFAFGGQPGALLAADESAQNPRMRPVLSLFLILGFYSLLIHTQKNAVLLFSTLSDVPTQGYTRRDDAIERFGQQGRQGQQNPPRAFAVPAVLAVLFSDCQSVGRSRYRYSGRCSVCSPQR